MMDEATIALLDAFPNAVRVKARDVRVGDSVFDTFGGLHVIDRVKHHKHHVSIKRADCGYADRFGSEYTITIVRGEG